MLGSDTLPVRDVLIDGENGLMMAQNDIEQIISKMNSYLSEPEKYKASRQYARELMVNNYDFKVCLPRLAGCYLN